MTQMPITISGNLTANPEFRRFDASGAQLCKLRVATSRRYPTNEKDAKNNTVWQDTDNLYIDVECWGQLAVNAAASLRRGFPVLVSGYLVTDVWDQETPGENGEMATTSRYSTKIRASKVAFELSNFQVSSARTNSAGNTLQGQEPVALKTAEDLAVETAEGRVSAEDGALSPAPAAANAAGHAGSGQDEETPPF